MQMNMKRKVLMWKFPQKQFSDRIEFIIVSNGQEGILLIVDQHLGCSVHLKFEGYGH